MQLTEEQIEAAAAQGCRFVEASEAQVRQFSMQRRVFYIEGKAFLAARPDGFYETAGTLLAQIAEVLRERKVSMPETDELAELPVDTGPDVMLSESEDAAPEPVPAAKAQVVMPPPVVGGRVTPSSSTVLSAMITITTGYMRGRQVDAVELSTLLMTVHGTLSGLKGERPR